MGTRVWTSLLSSVLLGSAGTHCTSDNPSGDGNGAGASTITTGLPADKKLSSFDNEDAQAACKSLSDGVSELISPSELQRARCAAEAINDTAKVNADKTQVTIDLAECNSVAQQCQANPASFGLEPITDEDDCDKAVANAQIMQCEATVAEYEACVRKILEQAKQGINGTKCENAETLIKTDGRPTKPDPDRIAECIAFHEKCPLVRVEI